MCGSCLYKVLYQIQSLDQLVDLCKRFNHLPNCVRHARRTYSNIPSFYPAITNNESQICALFLVFTINAQLSNRFMEVCGCYQVFATNRFSTKNRLLGYLISVLDTIKSMHRRKNVFVCILTDYGEVPEGVVPCSKSNLNPERKFQSCKPSYEYHLRLEYNL